MTNQIFNSQEGEVPSPFLKTLSSKDKAELNNLESSASTDGNKAPDYLQLVNLVKKEVSPFMTPEDESYISIQINGYMDTYPTSSSRFKRYLRSKFYLAKDRVPNKETIDRVSEHFSAMAFTSNEIHSVYIRTAFHEDTIYYDLANELRQVVAINKDSWTIITSPPVKFIRKKGLLSNVLPSVDGDINLLKKYLNLRDDQQWYLIYAFILRALFISPFPILVINGEQGCSKSTITKILSLLIDPSSTPLNSKPREERELFITAMNSLLMAFDNLSGLNVNTADTMCRLSTGAGVRLRALFTDDDEKLFKAAKPMILNGIDDIASRGDLISRSIFINPPVISSKNRITEEELWGNFSTDKEKILGGIFDSLVIALRNLPNTHLKEKPRMADFAIFACAASEGIGITPDQFIEAYNSNIKTANQNSLELDPIAVAIVKMLDDPRCIDDSWEGTMTELRVKLSLYLPSEFGTSKYLPQTPIALSNKIKRLAPMLAFSNIKIEKSRTAGSGNRLTRVFRDCPSAEVEICDNSDNSDDNLPF